MCRNAAVVYLKNRATRGWSASEEYQMYPPIQENEKDAFRARLLPVLASSQPQIRSQLIPVLHRILQYDFPEKWPNFLDISLQLLNANDAESVFTGLQCMVAICRVYRFKSGETREEFNKIVAASFPRLLAIGTRLVDEDSLEAGEMLRIVMKSYKHAIYVRSLNGGLREYDEINAGYSMIWRLRYGHTRRL